MACFSEGQQSIKCVFRLSNFNFQFKFFYLSEFRRYPFNLFTPFVVDEVQPAKQGEKYVNLSAPQTGLIWDSGQLQFLLHVENNELSIVGL